jgi:hypothetical protein
MFLIECDRLATVSPIAASRSDWSFAAYASAFASASPVCRPIALSSASCSGVKV